MRYSKFSLLSLMLAGSCAAIIGWATQAQAGNVLLPDDNNSAGSSGPNMGLVPMQNEVPAPAPVKTQQPQPQAQPQANVPAQAPVAEPQSAAPQAYLPYTPVPSASRKTGTQTPYKTPTMLIDTPETPDYSQLPGLELPFSAGVALSQQSVWSANDVTAINQKLGIAMNKVASACRISLSGMVLSDKMSGLIDSRGSTSTVTHFDGKVRSLMVSTRALCDVGTLPEGAGVVQKQGNYFIVPLSTATCKTPANGQVQQITITHGLAATDECAVR